MKGSTRQLIGSFARRRFSRSVREGGGWKDQGRYLKFLKKTHGSKLLRERIKRNF